MTAGVSRAKQALASPPVVEPAPALFPVARVDWRRARRVLVRAGLLALPVAAAALMHWTATSWQVVAHALLMAVLWAAVGAVVLMVLALVVTLVVKVIRALSGVGRWLIR